MPKVLHVDIETYSDVDLPKEGLPRYAASSSTEVLMIAACVDDYPVIVTDDLDSYEAQTVFELLQDKDYTKVAHNAAFEMAIFSQVLGVKINDAHWECTMIMAQSMGFPGALGMAVKAIGLDEKYHKDKDGMRLIRLFSMPQTPRGLMGGGRRNSKASHPEDWKKFMSYCKQDVEAERALHKRMVDIGAPTRG